jgi:uncharacterized protein YggE
MAKIKYQQTTILNICMENNTQITIADLDTIKNIIDLACTRGAFRGAEISQVGAVYDKLTSFLTAVIEQAKAQESANAEAGETQGE